MLFVCSFLMLCLYFFNDFICAFFFTSKYVKHLFVCLFYLYVYPPDSPESDGGANT